MTGLAGTRAGPGPVPGRPRPGSPGLRRLGSGPGTGSPGRNKAATLCKPSPGGMLRPHCPAEPREAAREGLPCAPQGRHKFPKRRNVFSGPSCCPPGRGRNMAFPGTSLSSPRPFPHHPLLPGPLQDLPAQERRKRPLTASLHFPPPPPSFLLLSLRPGGRSPQRAGAGT